MGDYDYYDDYPRDCWECGSRDLSIMGGDRAWCSMDCREKTRAADIAERQRINERLSAMAKNTASESQAGRSE